MKGKLAKILATGVGVLFAIALTVGGWGLYAIDAFLADWCGNEVLTVARSPDGVHVASAIERNCGATTSYVLAVTLHEYGDGLPSDWDDNAVYLLEGRGAITLRWVSETHLVVGLSRVQGPPFQKSPTWRNISVSYSYAE